MSTIAVAKLGMGYQGAGQRQGCKNCIHGEQHYVERMPPYDRAGWRCKKGGFFTTAMAICREHTPQRQGQPGGAA